MPLFYHLIGINGVAWASPAADLVGVLIALAVLLPYLRRRGRCPHPCQNTPDAIFLSFTAIRPAYPKISPASDKRGRFFIYRRDCFSCPTLIIDVLDMLIGDEGHTVFFGLGPAAIQYRF